MIVKRYYAQTMSEAMNVIRAELGPDAVILSSKPVRAKGLMGFFQKRQLEVIAAYEPRLESPRTREERESNAYATAIRVAKQEKELRQPEKTIPPAPGAALGPSGKPSAPAAPPKADMPNVTSAGRAVSAYQSAATKSNVRAPEGSSGPELTPAAIGQASADSLAPGAQAIQDALAAALAAREAARNAPPAKSAPEDRNGPQEITGAERRAREESLLREQQHFIPLSPPEMVITSSKREESAPAKETDDDRIGELERKLSQVADAIGAVADKIGSGDPVLGDEAKRVFGALEESDVEEKLARSLAREAQELAPRIGGTPREAAVRLLLREMRESGPLTFHKGERAILVFMGPTGVGKTTTLVKLATMCAVRSGLKVGVINTDTYRIAAQEQLKIYADILAVPQSVIYAPGDMVSALEMMQDREVVFVDTAGKRPGDPQHREDMMALLAAAGPQARAILCIAAPTGPRALREVIRHYDFLPDYGMILTKADETAGAGAAINACSFSGKNLHYLTAGQSVPDDIEEVDARVIVERLLS